MRRKPLFCFDKVLTPARAKRQYSRILKSLDQQRLNVSARIAAYYYTLGFWEGQSKDSADCARNKQLNLSRANEQMQNDRFVSVIAAEIKKR